MTQVELKKPMNYETTISIDILGHKSLDDVEKANWAKLWEGISSITPAAGDTQTSNSYWSDQGLTTTLVTGKKITFSISGNRVIGDPAQDYIASKFWDIGDSLDTLMKWDSPEGTSIAAKATLTTIVPFGGNANASPTFSFQLAINGQPKALTNKNETKYDDPETKYNEQGIYNN